MSLLGGTNRVGMFLGPFVAAVATHFGGFDAVYVVAIVLTGAAALVLFATVPAGRDDESRGSPVPVGEILRDHRHVFLTAGLAATSLQALRQARNVLLPLWADSIGLSVQTTAVLFGRLARRRAADGLSRRQRHGSLGPQGRRDPVPGASCRSDWRSCHSPTAR